jgi:hypothetical protein
VHFPKCSVEIVQGDTVVGKICHIKAVSPNGPCYDPRQTATKRHGYDNLLLLCANHHTMIDDDLEAYTVDRPVKMKGITSREQGHCPTTMSITQRGYS